MISAKSMNTPNTIIRKMGLSYFKCIKYVSTEAPFIEAIISATKTDNGPRSRPATTTDMVVKTSRVTSTAPCAK